MADIRRNKIVETHYNTAALSRTMPLRDYDQKLNNQSTMADRDCLNEVRARFDSGSKSLSSCELQLLDITSPLHSTDGTTLGRFNFFESFPLTWPFGRRLANWSDELPCLRATQFTSRDVSASVVGCGGPTNVSTTTCEPIFSLIRGFTTAVFREEPTTSDEDSDRFVDVAFPHFLFSPPLCAAVDSYRELADVAACVARSCL